jgi:polyferredoxin
LSSLIPILSKFIALIPVVGFLDKLLGFLAGAFNGAIISAVVVLIYYFVCASSCSTSIMNSVILKAFGLV